MATLIAAKVSLDDSPDFDCFVDPNISWNGWECPYFTDAQIGVVAEWLCRHKMEYFPSCEFVPELDSYLVRYFDGDVEMPEMDDVPGIILNDVHYFPLGAFSWCWNLSPDQENI